MGTGEKGGCNAMRAEGFDDDGFDKENGMRRFPGEGKDELKMRGKCLE